MSRKPLSFVDHLMLWIRWRWFLIGTVFIAAFITAAASYLVPKIYRATAVVLPPYDRQMNLPFLGSVDIDVFGSNEVSAAGLLTLLKSRNLKDRINSRIDLVKHYKTEDLEDAYQAFDDDILAEIETQESIGQVSLISYKIHYQDRDPQFAAQVINVMIEEWDKLNIELNQRTARLRREFLEQNMRDKGYEHAAAEESLLVFQMQHGLASIEEQVTGTVASAMLLERKIAEARVNVQVMEKVFQPDYPELKRTRLHLQELLKEEEKTWNSTTGTGLQIPLGTAPEISLQYYRHYYRMKMLETVAGVLVKLYEQAKFQEMKDIPALRVVDKGVVPLHKFKPKRMIMVLIASFSAFFLAVIAMYFLNYLAQIRGTEEYAWIETIGKELKADRDRLKNLLTRHRGSSP